MVRTGFQKSQFSLRQAWGSLAGHQTTHTLDRAEMALSRFPPRVGPAYCSPRWQVNEKNSFIHSQAFLTGRCIPNSNTLTNNDGVFKSASEKEARE